MEYVNFGKAGVQVSRLALGLGFRGQADEAEAQRVIEHTIDQGINLIDCAKRPMGQWMIVPTSVAQRLFWGRH